MWALWVHQHAGIKIITGDRVGDLHYYATSTKLTASSRERDAAKVAKSQKANFNDLASSS